MQSGAKCGRQQRADFLRRQAAIDALDHARVPVAHGWSDDFGGNAGQAHPLGVGAAQVVRRAGLDAGLLRRRRGDRGGRCSRAGRAGPRQERARARTRAGWRERGVGRGCAGLARPAWCRGCGPSRNRAERRSRRAFTDSLQHADVATMKPTCAARAGGRRASSCAELLGREGTRSRPVIRSEAGRQERIEVAEPQPRALGELERGSKSHQLLGDGVIAHRFRAPAGDVAVDVCCSQVGEKERLVLAVVQVLEDAGQVAGLAPVERHRLVAASAGGGLFCAALEEQRERVAQRGLLRGSVGRIGAVPLELSERKLGRLEVGAAGRDLTPRAVLVDVARTRPRPRLVSRYLLLPMEFSVACTAARCSTGSGAACQPPGRFRSRAGRRGGARTPSTCEQPNSRRMFSASSIGSA